MNDAARVGTSGDAARVAAEEGLDRKSPLLVWIAALATLAWFLLLGAHPLFNPDEGRYAEIPREMLVSGQWIVPHLNDLAYIEKPPLQYWATALSFATFGLSEWAARFYTGLCGFLTVVAVAMVARRVWGYAAGWRAAFMTGSSLLLVLMSHQLTLDMSLTFYLTVMVGAFILAQHLRADARRNSLWMRIAWVAAALAVLTKGLIAVVLPGATLVIYSLVQRDRIVWRRLSPVSGLVLFLIIAVPWFVLIQRELPAFFDFFFIREHFTRYLTRMADRYEPWWFFIPILLVGCLPWVLPAARTLAFGWRSSVSRGEFDARRFLWVWCVVTFCFFSASDSKLVPYILPMFPTLALLMATEQEERLRLDLRMTAVGVMAGGVLLLALTASAPVLVAASATSPYVLGLRPYGFMMGAVLIVGGFATHRLRGPSLSLASGIAAASYLCTALLLVGGAALAPLYSGAALASQLPPSLIGDSPVFSIRTYDQTLPFYLERTVTLVEERNEMDFGLVQEPSHGIATLALFEARWRKLDQAFAVMEGDTLTVLQQRGLPMVVRAHDLKRIVVSRR